MTPEIVTAARSGDADALGLLAAQSLPVAFREALGVLRHWQDAEDCSQDAVARALHFLAELREPAAYPKWLRLASYRLALDRRRFRDRIGGRPVSHYGDRPPESRRRPDDPAEAAEAAEFCRAAVASLRPIDRRSLEDFYLRGLPVSTCAKRWGVPPSTARTRLHHARRRARAALSRTA